MPITTSDVSLFRDLFFHRRDVFAEMFRRRSGEKAGEIGYSPACTNRWDKALCNGGKCRQCRNFAGPELSDDVIMAHFKGERTIGTYLVSPQGTVNTCVLDVDIGKVQTDRVEVYRERVKALASELYRIAEHHNLNPVIEDSGNKGYHLWIFFDSPIPAGKAQALGSWLAGQVEHYEGLHVEVFPKQEAIDQYGNLVKVPVGMHLKTEKRCLLVDPGTFEGRVSDQMERLRAIKTVSEDTVNFLFGEYDITLPVGKASNNGHVPQGGRLPCLAKMWGGVTEGCRDEVAFRLAVHLYRQGMPEVFAQNALVRWDSDYNDPPMGDAAIVTKVGSAYTGKYGLGCDNPLIQPFCDPSCPIYKKRHEPEPAIEEEVRSSTDLRFLKIDATDSTMIFCRAGLEYRCSGIDVEKQGVKATVELRKDEKTVHKDRLGLAVANRRKGYARECIAHDPSLDYQAIVNDLTQLDDLIKLKEAEVFAALESEKNGARYIMSTEEEARALELLKSPKLLWQAKQVIEKLGVVGEDTNKLVIFLAYTSRMLTDPIQILVKGESSSGKSYTTRKVLHLFPKECYTELTDMTPQALFYIKSLDLRHHILLVFEKHGGEKADYTIRTSQSEGILRIWVVVKDKDTNELTTKEVTVEGPVMFCVTTTETIIHSENETRNVSLYTDDSEAQTKAIRNAVVREYLLDVERPEPEVLQNWRNIQRMLKSYDVIIPYVKELSDAFPTQPVRVRRDFPRFLALIQTVTLLHQYQREVIEQNGKQYVKATIGDYYIAKALAEKIFAQSIIELGPKSVEILDFCIANKDTSPFFTYGWLAEQMNWKRETVKKWTYPLFRNGYVSYLQDDDDSNDDETAQPKKKRGGGKRKAARFVLTDKEREAVSVLPKPGELVAKYPALREGVYDPLTGEEPDDVPSF